MSNLKELLEIVNKSISITKNKYVLYNKETGKINSISNSEQELENHDTLVVPDYDVQKILEGERCLSDYAVEYDMSTKEFLLKEVSFVPKLTSVNEMIYKIQKMDETNTYDLLIFQDLTHKCWTISINLEIFEKLKVSSKTNLFFSITDKDDINILYRTFNVNMGDLLKSKRIEIPFKYDSEADAQNVSIYTTKYFHTYGYKTI